MNPTRPLDLANMCGVFHELGSRHIDSADLLQHLSGSMAIDSYATAEEVLREGIACDLIRDDKGTAVLTQNGRRAAKAQGGVRPDLTEEAKRAMVKFVYLNADVGERCCGPFLNTWRVDSTRRTFVLDRVAAEGIEVTAWLTTLYQVGLIEVGVERAEVQHSYLELVNALLGTIRGATPLTAAGAIANAVGHLGELLCVEYEKSRLSASGHEWLALLVERISVVDPYAGYDVRSFLGVGSKPDMPIHIEVKATQEGVPTFTWTRNERAVAARERRGYWIYAYTHIDLDARAGRGPKSIRDPHAAIKAPEYVVEPKDVLVSRAGSRAGSVQELKSESPTVRRS